MSQLLDNEVRDRALKEVVTLVSTNQLEKHLTSPEVADILLKFLRNYITGRKISETMSELVNEAWLAIISKIRVLGRIAELHPNLDSYLWKLLSEDAGKHDNRYSLPFMILKTLTTLPGGENSLPQVAAEFERLSNALSGSTATINTALKTIPLVAQLIAFYDPKYVPYLAKKTDIFANCNKILTYAKTASISLDLPESATNEESKKKSKSSSKESSISDETAVVFGLQHLDSILALLRFFGPSYREQMINNNIFESVKAIAMNSSDSKLRVTSIKFLEQFQIDLSSSESTLSVMVDSALNESNAYLRHKLVAMIMDSLRDNSNIEKEVEFKIIKAALHWFQDPFEAINRVSIDLLNWISPSIRSLVEAGMLTTYIYYLDEVYAKTTLTSAIPSSTQINYINNQLVNNLVPFLVKPKPQVKSKSKKKSKTADNEADGTSKAINDSPDPNEDLYVKIVESNVFAALSRVVNVLFDRTTTRDMLVFWLALPLHNPIFEEPSKPLYNALISFFAEHKKNQTFDPNNHLATELLLLTTLHLLKESTHEIDSTISAAESQACVSKPSAHASLKDQCDYRQKVANIITKQAKEYEKSVAADEKAPATGPSMSVTPHWYRLDELLESQFFLSILSSYRHDMFATTQDPMERIICTLLPDVWQPQIAETIVRMVSMPSIHTIRSAYLLTNTFVRVGFHPTHVFDLLLALCKLPPEWFWVSYDDSYTKNATSTSTTDLPNLFQSHHHHLFVGDVSREISKAPVIPPTIFNFRYELALFMLYFLNCGRLWMSRAVLKSNSGKKHQHSLDIVEFLTIFMASALNEVPESSSSSSSSAEKSSISWNTVTQELDRSKLALSHLSIICDTLAVCYNSLPQGTSTKALTSRLDLIGERRFWITTPSFISFLMSLSSSSNSILSMIAAVSSLGLDVVCSDILAANQSKAHSGSTNESPSSAPNLPSDELSAVEKCKQMMKSIMSSSAARLNALESALKALLQSRNAVDPQSIEELGQQLKILWPSVRDYFYSTRAMNHRLNWMWHLAVVSNYILYYNDCNWRFDTRPSPYVPRVAFSDFKDSYIFAQMGYMLMRTDMVFIPMMDAFRNYPGWQRPYFQYVFSSDVVDCVIPHPIEHTDHPKWSWNDRMKTLQIFLDLTLDSLDNTPLDDLLPLVIDEESLDSAALARVKILGWPHLNDFDKGDSPPLSASTAATAATTAATDGIDPADATASDAAIASALAAPVDHLAVAERLQRDQMRVKEKNRLCLITAFFIIDTINISVLQAAVYPCPSISKRSMHWLLDKFWPNIPTHKEDTTLNAMAKEASINLLFQEEPQFSGTRLLKPSHYMGYFHAAMPQMISSFYLVHGNDPSIMLKFWKLLSDKGEPILNPNNTEIPWQLSPQYSDSTVCTIANSIISRYFRHLWQLFTTPIAWEEKNIKQVTPIESPFSLSPYLNRRGEAYNSTNIGWFKPFKMPEHDVKMNGARYTSSGVWTDYDELDWFTTPIALPHNGSRRFSPLDLDVLAARESHWFYLESDVAETRPLVNFDIPEGASWDKKCEIYSDALSAVISEACRYLVTWGPIIKPAASHFPNFLSNRCALPSAETWRKALENQLSIQPLIPTTTWSYTPFLRADIAPFFMFYAPTLVFKYLAEWFIPAELEDWRVSVVNHRGADHLNLPNSLSLCPTVKPAVNSFDTSIGEVGRKLNIVPLRPSRAPRRYDLDGSEISESYTASETSSSSSIKATETRRHRPRRRRRRRRGCHDSSDYTGSSEHSEESATQSIESVPSSRSFGPSEESDEAEMEVASESSSNSSSNSSSSSSHEENKESEVKEDSNAEKVVKEVEEKLKSVEIEESKIVTSEGSTSADAALASNASATNIKSLPEGDTATPTEADALAEEAHKKWLENYPSRAAGLAINFAWYYLSVFTTSANIPNSVNMTGGMLLKAMLERELVSGGNDSLVPDSEYFYMSILPVITAFGPYLPSDYLKTAQFPAHLLTSKSTSLDAPISDSTTSMRKNDKSGSKKKDKASHVKGSDSAADGDLPSDQLLSFERYIRGVIDHLISDLSDVADELRTYYNILKTFKESSFISALKGQGFLSLLDHFNEKRLAAKNAYMFLEEAHQTCFYLTRLHLISPKSFRTRMHLLGNKQHTFENDFEFEVRVRRAELGTDDSEATSLQRLALLDFGENCHPIGKFSRTGPLFHQENALIAQLHSLVASVIKVSDAKHLLSDPIWHSQLSVFRIDVAQTRSVLPYRVASLLAMDGFFDRVASNSSSTTNNNSSTDYPIVNGLKFTSYRLAASTGIVNQYASAQAKALAMMATVAHLCNERDYLISEGDVIRVAQVNDAVHGLALDVWNNGAGIPVDRYTQLSLPDRNWHIIRTWYDLHKNPSLAACGPNGEALLDKKGTKTIPRFARNGSDVKSVATTSRSPKMYAAMEPIPFHLASSVTALYPGLDSANAVWENYSMMAYSDALSNSWEVLPAMQAIRVYTGRAKESETSGDKQELINLIKEMLDVQRIGITPYYFNNYKHGYGPISLSSFDPSQFSFESNGLAYISYSLNIKKKYLEMQSARLTNKASSSSSSAISSATASSSFTSSPLTSARTTVKAISSDSMIPDSGLRYYAALPYNRIVHVWHDVLGTSLVQGTRALLRLDFERKLFPNPDVNAASYRIGMATRAAIQELNSHPFLQVGDVPGSFALAPRENGLFSEGKFFPLLWHTLPVAVTINYVSMLYDPNNHALHFFGPQVQNGIVNVNEGSYMLRLPTDPSEELIPIISTGTFLKYSFYRAAEPRQPVGCIYPSQSH